jgi:hypothetical protein
MAYTKTTWVNETLAGAERFDIKEDNGDAFKADMQIVLATTVTLAGTELNATNLNHIEQGIEDAHSTAQELRSTDEGTLPSTGTGVEIYYDGTRSTVVSIDRATNTHKVLRIQGLPSVILVGNSAPSDGVLFYATGLGTMMFYLDEAGENIKIRVQKSDGSYKTATIAMV